MVKASKAEWGGRVSWEEAGPDVERVRWFRYRFLPGARCRSRVCVGSGGGAASALVLGELGGGGPRLGALI